ncbi:ATP-binding protein [Micrococcus flavus]|uniref:DNA-binding Lrp family transcriptional regulator n=1 Tax=Micrococcus flavus TaxID=384602 RepID=A0A4Y8X3Z9_9MICC|nr:AAA family ATPase [Micrococcus flavus]MBB4881903.1 DNA-binding Lrp family transcriptional regulator [Micrococcus flavus]TFI03557.1 ATP-binding protein [Micrococcus flavus]GGK45877.1 ATPase AAA [Micrococcus flavus]
MANPFKPSAGTQPPLLVGRRDVLDEFTESLEDGPGAPGRLAFVTGARGVGKTVMLTKIGLLAEQAGWVVIDETATAGLLDRLTRSVRARRIETGVTDRSRTKALKVGIGRAFEVTKEFAEPPADALDLRTELGRLLESPLMSDYGVLITVDEIHTINTVELEQLAAVTQHLLREGRNIALVMAGIPQAVDQLIADNAQRPRVSTFLRRAERMELGAVEVADVAASFIQIASEAGVEWPDDVAQVCAAATGGYPFMIQLVGYHTWRAARGMKAITRAHAEAGIADARRKIGNLVHAPALQDLSDVDRTILLAMAQDDGPSRPREIAQRIGQGTNYVSVYRRRLESAGMVEIRPDGRWAFATPELREYLREHGAHLAMSDFDADRDADRPSLF